MKDAVLVVAIIGINVSLAIAFKLLIDHFEDRK